MRSTRILIIALTTAGALAAGWWMLGAGLAQAGRSVRSVIGHYETGAKRQFMPGCQHAGIAWPPRRITLIALKSERRLEVWGAAASGAFAKLAEFPILAASGRLGPKRREGALRVPEGDY